MEKVYGKWSNIDAIILLDPINPHSLINDPFRNGLFPIGIFKYTSSGYSSSFNLRNLFSFNHPLSNHK